MIYTWYMNKVRTTTTKVYPINLRAEPQTPHYLSFKLLIPTKCCRERKRNLLNQYKLNKYYTVVQKDRVPRSAQRDLTVYFLFSAESRQLWIISLILLEAKIIDASERRLQYNNTYIIIICTALTEWQIPLYTSTLTHITTVYWKPVITSSVRRVSHVVSKSVFEYSVIAQSVTKPNLTK